MSNCNNVVPCCCLALGDHGCWFGSFVGRMPMYSCRAIMRCDCSRPSTCCSLAGHWDSPHCAEAEALSICLSCRSFSREQSSASRISSRYACDWHLLRDLLGQRKGVFYVPVASSRSRTCASRHCRGASCADGPQGADPPDTVASALDIGAP